MSMQRMWVLGLSLVLVLGAVTALSPAEEPKKAEPGQLKEMTAQEKDEALAEIALAFELADVGGRAGSPEALVAAARKLNQIAAKGIEIMQLEGVKPVTGKAEDREKLKAGDPIKEEGGKPIDLKAQIEEFLAKARKLNTSKDPQVAALIDSVKVVGARGSLRGPATLGPFFIEPGEVSEFTFNFRGGQTARVVANGLNNVLIQLEIYRPNGTLVTSITGRGSLEWDWTPNETKAFSVYVTNKGNRTAKFNLYKN